MINKAIQFVSLFFLLGLLSSCALLPQSVGKEIGPDAARFESQLRIGMDIDEIMRLADQVDLTGLRKIGIPKETFDEICEEPKMCVPRNLASLVKFKSNNSGTVVVANEMYGILYLTVGRLLYRIDLFFSQKDQKLIGWASNGVWSPRKKVP